MSRARSVTLFAKAEPAMTGTARYAAALADQLPALGYRVALRRSRAPWPGALTRPLRRLGLDLDAFWTSYPLLAGPARPGVLHLTAQTLATALLAPRPRRPTVVTVHDILPYTLRHDPTLGTIRHPLDLLFYRLALRGLARADLVLADSAYTAAELDRAVGLGDGRVRVVPLGVDGRRFHPDRPTDELRAGYGLVEGERYVIYVGSEDPRKNLPALWRAFARVLTRHPEVRLLKVGTAHHQAERARLEELGRQLGIAAAVRFLGQVSDEALRSLYGLAAVCVVPSLYEGFGLPVLEAMACGAPVVCSNRTSLPEVAADAALVVEPEPESLAAAIARILADPAGQDELRQRGLRRAAAYTWRRTAEQTAAAYEDLRAQCGNP
ncbi:MAG TPA: glycosyltransferase family 1 protein [Chloroflexota bacterium]